MCGFHEENLLRFIEVGNMPFLVNTTTEVTSSSTESRPATDEANMNVSAMQECFPAVEG
jgi:hypothetical protein